MTYSILQHPPQQTNKRHLKRSTCKHHHCDPTIQPRASKRQPPSSGVKATHLREGNIPAPYGVWMPKRGHRVIMQRILVGVLLQFLVYIYLQCTPSSHHKAQKWGQLPLPCYWGLDVQFFFFVANLERDFSLKIKAKFQTIQPFNFEDTLYFRGWINNSRLHNKQFTQQSISDLSQLYSQHSTVECHFVKL